MVGPNLISRRTLTNQILITGCGTFIPPEVIDNETLVKAYNAHVKEHNQEYSEEIAVGDKTALKTSSADFIKPTPSSYELFLHLGSFG